MYVRGQPPGGMLNPVVLSPWSNDVDLAPRSPLPYAQCLIQQGYQYRRRDRVYCVNCLRGQVGRPCRCKYVDLRGRLAGVGSPIYFLPDSPTAPGNCCRVNVGQDCFAIRPCQYRISEIIPSPWGKHKPHLCVWIRCDVATCACRACFPYGLGIRGGVSCWVAVKRIACLLRPFISSWRGRVRRLVGMRALAQATPDLEACLLDLYGISSLLHLRCTCKGLSLESSLRVITQVYNP